MTVVAFNLARAQAKSLFFDRAKVKNLLDARTRRYLNRVGGYVRLSARHSIKPPGAMTLAEMSPEARRIFRIRQAIAKRKGEPAPRKWMRQESSKPGHPPLSQTGLLRSNIFYSLEPARLSVVIGPVKLNRASDAPRILEHGGTSTIKTRGGRTLHRRIAKRPYMQPALVSAAAGGKTRQFWEDAARRA